MVVSFGMQRYSFAEDTTSSLIDVTLSQAHSAPITVDVRSQDVTALG